MAFSPNATIAGQITANVHAQGPTSQMAFNGNVNARNLEMTGKQIPQPVKVPEISLDHDATADSVQQLHGDLGQHFTGASR